MKTILILLLAIVSMGSCKKILDVEPEDFVSPENYFETETQLNYGLNAVYAALTESGTYANNMLGRMGLDADEGFNNYTLDLASVGDYNVPANDVKVQQYWTALYQGINQANLLLENINKPAMDETRRGNIKGQALFLRSYYYLMLVTRYGGVPLVLSTLKSPSADSVQLPRTPAAQVYARILQDMEAASLLVDGADVVGKGGRVSKSAVWGVMARTCLYMAGNPINDRAKYADAKKWAGMVINSGFHKLNASYSDVFMKHSRDEYDIKESIWEVEFFGNGIGLYTSVAGMVGRNNGIGNTHDENYGYAVGVLHSTKWLYNLYSATDLRRDWAIAPFRYVGDPAVITNWSTSQLYDRYCGKWRRVYEVVLPRTEAKTPQNFPLLRYADVLLMYAEADNEAGGTPSVQAYEAINQVRRRAVGKPVDVPDATVDLKNLDKNSFFLEVQDERARELCFECLRKNDLVRWNIFLSRMKSILPDVQSATTVIGGNARKTYANASARDVLWPIPSYEIGVNKKLEQNTGW